MNRHPEIPRSGRRRATFDARDLVRVNTVGGEHICGECKATATGVIPGRAPLCEPCQEYMMPINTYCRRCRRWMCVGEANTCEHYKK